MPDLITPTSWQDFKTIVLRGHATTADPTAVGYVEKELAVKSYVPTLVPESEVTLSAAGTKDRKNNLWRWTFEIEFWPFNVEAGRNPIYQDFADWQYTLQNILSLEYIWIYRAYQKGNDHGAGYIEVSHPDGSGSLYNLTTDSPSGLLPISVLWEEIDQSESDEGLITVSVTFIDEDRA